MSTSSVSSHASSLATAPVAEIRRPGNGIGAAMAKPSKSVFGSVTVTGTSPAAVSAVVTSPYGAKLCGV